MTSVRKRVGGGQRGFARLLKQPHGRYRGWELGSYPGDEELLEALRASEVPARLGVEAEALSSWLRTGEGASPLGGSAEPCEAPVSRKLRGIFEGLSRGDLSPDEAEEMAVVLLRRLGVAVVLLVALLGGSARASSLPGLDSNQDPISARRRKRRRVRVGRRPDGHLTVLPGGRAARRAVLRRASFRVLAGRAA